MHNVAGVWSRKAWLVALGLVVILGGTRIASAQGRPDEPGAKGHHPPHIFSPKGSPRNRTSNLLDHGGPILPTSHVYGIYWGTFGSSDIATAMSDFFSGFGSSRY